ncbi:MAG: MSHA biogenesis protein MshL [Candidatus Jettenia ecosi]|uniref:MSHA biogenesis protein MshL n=1 Tax=Candidatus Jettenia ecosi TaxID=2494326 RepID=A0A533QHT2_9BACT|nr:MAG: MSHA biogenesis protein MshL [Candidatus Jettenia ecosi]
MQNMVNIILIIILNIVLLLSASNQIGAQDASKTESTTLNNHYLKIAKIYFELKDYPNAIEALELAILLEPANREAQILLKESRQCLEGKKMLSKIQSNIDAQKETIAAPPPAHKDISALLGDVYTAIYERRYDDAAEISDFMLKIDPLNKKVLYIKGKLNDIRHEHITEYLKTIDAQEKLKSNEYLRELSIPHQEILRFPAKEQWKDASDRILPDLDKIVKENKRKTKQLQMNLNPVESAPPKEIEDALNMIISFEFLDTPLKDVIIFLREKTNINMIIDSEAGDVLITLKLKDVPLRVALKYILPKGYEYVIEGDILHIYKQKMELRVYDVRDILINLDDKDPLEFDITASSSQLSMRKKETVKTKDPSERVSDLIELIVTTIEPASWSYRTHVIGAATSNGQRHMNIPGQGEGSIIARAGHPGDLVVVNSKFAHKQIENLLASLRSSQNLQVNIEARFISVTDEFLEDIGSNFSKFFSDDTSIDTGAETDISELVAGSGLSLNYSILHNSMLKGFIRAVQESKDSEILTSPRITLSNTQRGNIAVVKTTNYIQSTSVAEGVVTPVIGTIPEGTTFDVRPIVSADRKYIYLEVTPSVFQIETIESFTFTGVGTDTTLTTGGTGVVNIPPTSTVQLPTINVSQVSVTVCVPDKGTLIIGGLGSINKDDQTTGIPVLSKIPLLKRLFSRSLKNNRKSNLIILLKPTIIIKEEQEADFLSSISNKKFHVTDLNNP